MQISQKYTEAKLQNGFATKAIRAGYIPGPELSHSEPIFVTSAYHYENADYAAELYRGEIPGNVYTRIQNPTTDIFEKRIASLENAEAGLATASGMSAISLTLLHLLSAGDNIVAAQEVYGGSNQLLRVSLPKFGITTTFVKGEDLAQWEAAITPATKIIFFETPTNPTLTLVDIRKVCEIAKAKGILTIVDNTIATPALQNPINLGVDIVIHSATKYIDGQGRAIGGVICGKRDLLNQIRAISLRNFGSCLSPFDAWIFLKGLETLELRMEKHSANALAIAQFLSAHPRVKKVNYPFLPSHPQYELAKSQQKAGSGLLSFEVENLATGRNLIDSVKLISLVGNLGDTKTIIGHPASTSHQQLSVADAAASGITPGLIRLSVGLESVEDLVADLTQALG